MVGIEDIRQDVRRPGEKAVGALMDGAALLGRQQLQVLPGDPGPRRRSSNDTGFSGTPSVIIAALSLIASGCPTGGTLT